MKCPHCLTSYHPQMSNLGLGKDIDGDWAVSRQTCPSCHKFIIALLLFDRNNPDIETKHILVYPKAISRNPLPDDVPDIFAQDYWEACLVLTDSPKASAALSRRCLQNILREKARVRKSELSREIDEILKSNHLPSYYAERIDAIRNIGNFAAHPIKSTNTGEIVDVEPGEAQWLLDILEGLFDFYFVQPSELQRKCKELNNKLIDAGKPPMK